MTVGRSAFQEFFCGSRKSELSNFQKVRFCCSKFFPPKVGDFFADSSPWKKLQLQHKNRWKNQFCMSSTRNHQFQEKLKPNSTRISLWWSQDIQAPELQWELRRNLPQTLLNIESFCGFHFFHSQMIQTQHHKPRDVQKNCLKCKSIMQNSTSKSEKGPLLPMCLAPVNLAKTKKSPQSSGPFNKPTGSKITSPSVLF